MVHYDAERVDNKRKRIVYNIQGKGFVHRSSVQKNDKKHLFGKKAKEAEVMRKAEAAAQNRPDVPGEVVRLQGQADHEVAQGFGHCSHLQREKSIILDKRFNRNVW